MSYAPCWYQTKIHAGNAIKSSYIWPDFKQMTTNTKAIGIDPQDILDPDWIALLQDNGLFDISAILFYSAENYASNAAHTDINGYADNPRFPSYAFNLVVGIDTKDMVWFDPNTLRSGYQEIVYKTDHGNGVYGKWPWDLSQEIDRARIGDCLTLVRVDVPHWISPSDQPRLCVSLRFFSSELETATWDEALHLFKDIIVAR